MSGTKWHKLSRAWKSNAFNLQSEAPPLSRGPLLTLSYVTLFRDCGLPRQGPPVSQSLYFKFVFFNLLQYCLFYVLLFWPRGMWESSLPNQGLNLLPLHWKAKSQPLDHQGSLSPSQSFLFLPGRLYGLADPPSSHHKLFLQAPHLSAQKLLLK